MSHVLDILHERGFIKQIMGEDKLKEKMSNGPMTFYIGFDPTGDCLHVGHLLPIMCMAWLQRAGHKPIIVLGGGTAMVGDPSGKEKTRRNWLDKRHLEKGRYAVAQCFRLSLLMVLDY